MFRFSIVYLRTKILISDVAKLSQIEILDQTKLVAVWLLKYFIKLNNSLII